MSIPQLLGTLAAVSSPCVSHWKLLSAIGNCPVRCGLWPMNGWYGNKRSSPHASVWYNSGGSSSFKNPLRDWWTLKLKQLFLRGGGDNKLLCSQLHSFLFYRCIYWENSPSEVFAINTSSIFIFREASLTQRLSSWAGLLHEQNMLLHRLTLAKYYYHYLV